MILRKKKLPEPFKESLIKSLKEIKELTNLESPHKLKNFNFASSFLYMRKNEEFIDFVNIADKMKRLNYIYQFLINFNEKNNIIDTQIHLDLLEKLNKKKIEPDDYLKQLTTSISVDDYKKIHSDFKQKVSKISNESYFELRKKLEKEYRKNHKQISKKLEKLRSRSG